MKLHPIVFGTLVSNNKSGICMFRRDPDRPVRERNSAAAA